MKSMYVYVRTKVHFISTCRATKQFGCRLFFNRREHFFLKEKKHIQMGHRLLNVYSILKRREKKYVKLMILQKMNLCTEKMLYGSNILTVIH